MRKMILFVAFSSMVALVALAQTVTNGTIEEIRRFDFGRPFPFVAKPQGDDDSGVGPIYFTGDNRMVLTGTYNNLRFVYDKDGNLLQTLPGQFGGPFSLSTIRYTAFFDAGGGDVNAWIYPKDDFTKPLWQIRQTGRNNVSLSTTFINKNMIFSKGPGRSGSLVSWELLESGVVRFRNEQETADWLATNEK